MKYGALFFLLAGLAAGGAGGYYLKQTELEEIEDGSVSKWGREREGERIKLVLAGEEKLPPEVEALLGNGALTAANAAERTVRVLSEPDPLRRHAAVGILLLSLDASNIRAVKEGFEEITKKSGRRHDAEWALLMASFGKILGGEGIQELMSSRGDACMAMEGLAALNPAAARKALGKIDANDKDLRRAWVKGLALKDPGRAFDLIISGEEPGADAGAVMGQAIQALGLEGAGALLQKAMGADQENEENLARFQGLYRSLTDAMFYQHWQAGTPEKMRAWLTLQKGGPQISGDILWHAAKDAMLSGQAAEGFAWLRDMNEGQNGDMTGAREMQEHFVRNPRDLGALDAAAFETAVGMMPSNPETMLALAARMHREYPGRAARLREQASRLAAPQESGETSSKP